MADRDATDTKSTSPEKLAKKPYSAPTLLRWGTFSDLTRQNNHSNSHDSGRGGSKGTN